MRHSHAEWRGRMEAERKRGFSVATNCKNGTNIRETRRSIIRAMKRLFLRAIFPALLLCQLGAAQQNVRTIFLVRHAEKASAAADAPLSSEGQKRAECLATTLKDAGIKQIYVTDV